MAEGARKLGEDRYTAAELVPTATDLERAIESGLEQEKTAFSTRDRARLTLLEQNWQPRVSSEMRQKVDEAYDELFELSEEECALKRESIKQSNPELFQAMLDAIEDDNDLFTAEAPLLEEERRVAEETYLRAERLLNDAGKTVLDSGRRAIQKNPMFRRLTESIDTDGEELPMAVGQS